MIVTYERYEVLITTRIQGIAEVYTELQNIYAMFTNKRPNISIEDGMFETDCIAYNNKINEWKIRLKDHIHAVFHGIPDFGNKIELLKRCEKLNLDGLELDSLYITLFEHINNRNYET